MSFSLVTQSQESRITAGTPVLRRERVWLLLLGVAILLFYVQTTAPTVLWGDDAHFQHTAFSGTLRADGGGHWLWLQAARLMLHLPWGDVAYRVNLLSALAASGTVLLLYLVARAASLSWQGATTAALSFAVSHTFWMHAIRAEVYTVFTLFLALQLLLWLLWQPQRIGPLYSAAALFGTTLLAHQMALFLIPAGFVLLWQRRAWLQPRQWGWALLILGLGLLPFIAVLHLQIMRPAGVTHLGALNLYFTHAGTDFSSALLDYSSAALPRDAILWLGLLALQFPSPALLLVVWGILHRTTWRNSGPWLTLLVLYAVNVLFAFSYRVNDHYVFFLPGYLVLALFAGAGWDAARAKLHQYLGRRSTLTWPALALLALLPLLVYYSVPRLLDAAELNPLGIRSLPGRDPNLFFLWPPKHNHWAAARYGQTVFDALPPDAVVIADHTPLETLRYFQIVEGRRPDVRLVKIEPGDDLAPVVAAQDAGRPLFLADSNPEYYAWQALPGAALEPLGPVFHLTFDPPYEARLHP